MEVDGKLVLVGVIGLVMTLRRTFHIKAHREEIVKTAAAYINQLMIRRFLIKSCKNVFVRL